MKGIVIAGGEIPPKPELLPFLSENAYIVAADSGYDNAKKLGLSPNLIIGDMDSVSSQNIKCERINYPPKKDFTDSELALDYLIKKGCTELLFLGMTGSRLDHSLANIFLLKKCADLNISAVLITPGNRCYLVKNKITLTKINDEYLSLIPLTDCHGVTTEGLLYPLNGETLYAGSCRGVSNQFLESKASISIENGYLYVVQSKQD